jgi:hypothetical protein
MHATPPIVAPRAPHIVVDRPRLVVEADLLSAECSVDILAHHVVAFLVLLLFLLVEFVKDLRHLVLAAFSEGHAAYERAGEKYPASFLESDHLKGGIFLVYFATRL